jgi:hypothetical protein
MHAHHRLRVGILVVATALSAIALSLGASRVPAVAAQPTGGPWSLRASLATHFRPSTATVLHDGRVLVTGAMIAADGSFAGPHAEIYDPAADTWSPAASPQSLGSAVLLPDGDVLLVGEDPTVNSYSSPVLVQRYRPATNQWTSTRGPVPAPNAAVELADGRVLMMGGSCGALCHLSASEVYDPASGAWSPAGEMSGIASDAGLSRL